MFTRLAYFIEKKGFRGRLMTNVQLAGRHGWNAHDYGPDGLASFYNAASASAFPLNLEEKALKSLALREQILIPNGGEVEPGRGGILAISRSSSAIERRYLLTHESFHGIFFSSQEYRAFCLTLWDSLPSSERRFYTQFLDSLGYDGSDRFLAVNEFQAYLMQQPINMPLRTSLASSLASPSLAQAVSRGGPDLWLPRKSWMAFFTLTSRFVPVRRFTRRRSGHDSNEAVLSRCCLSPRCVRSACVGSSSCFCQ